VSSTTSNQHGVLLDELDARTLHPRGGVSNGQSSSNGPGTWTVPKPAGVELSAFTDEMLQIAVDAINAHFPSLEIWKHPSIGSALMRVASGTQRVSTEFRAQMAKEPAQPRILVVDDAQDVLVAVGAFLTREGCLVVKASDGEEALRLIASDPLISLLVTDFIMPGLNGADLITQALELRPNLQALVITGYPKADGLNEISSRVRILTKPFRRDALVAAVGALLGKETAGAEVASGQGPDAPLDGDVRTSAESKHRLNLAADSVRRPAVDLVAEGMWRFSAGEHCQEPWGMLPLDQRLWWTSCATEAVGDWVARSVASDWGNR
jgi:CheY-like chemotaxis protein